MTWRASGFRAWLFQRLTAVYMALFLVWFAFSALINSPSGYEEWRAWIASGATSIALAIFFLSLLFHAWVGVRDILIDYVHPFAVRFALLCTLGLGLVFMGLWVLRVLFKAAL